MATKLPNKKLDLNKIDIVYYHSPCSDGAGAKNVVHHYYLESYGEERAKEIRYIGLKHPFTPDDAFYVKATGKNVLMLDFALKADQLTKLLDLCNSFLVLDHHATAQDDLANFPVECKVFDMERSGVGITWDTFFPGRPMPSVVAFVQDQELWKFRLPETQAFNCVFYNEDESYETWKKYLDPTLAEKTIEKGRTQLAYKDQLVDSICEYARYQLYDYNGSYIVGAFATTPLFRSEVGAALMKNHRVDFSGVYTVTPDGSDFSLRSTKDRTGVAEIAKLYGGGGHREAAGCRIDDGHCSLPKTEGLTPLPDYGLLKTIMTEKSKTFYGPSGQCYYIYLDCSSWSLKLSTQKSIVTAIESASDSLDELSMNLGKIGHKELILWKLVLKLSISSLLAIELSTASVRELEMLEGDSKFTSALIEAASKLETLSSENLGKLVDQKVTEHILPTMEANLKNPKFIEMIHKKLNVNIIVISSAAGIEIHTDGAYSRDVIENYLDMIKLNEDIRFV